MKFTLWIICIFVSVSCPLAKRYVGDTLVQKVSDFIHHVGWTKVTIVCSPQDTLCFTFSIKLRKMLNQVTQNMIFHSNFTKVVDPVTSYIFTPNCGVLCDSEWKSMLNLIKSVPAYSSLIISKEDGWKSLIGVPLGFYHENQHQRAIVKVVATRRRDDPQAFEYFETGNLLSHNMQGANLHAVTMPYEPYMNMGLCKKGSPCQQVTGFAYELLQAVAVEYNFTMSVYYDESKIWGSVPININGMIKPATGILKTVMDGKNDLPICPWVLTSLRFSYVDFTYPFHNLEYRCFANVNQVKQ